MSNRIPTDWAEDSSFNYAEGLRTSSRPTTCIFEVVMDRMHIIIVLRSPTQEATEILT